jgi:DNA mismatch endonuclease (patch repair protein)
MHPKIPGNPDFVIPSQKLAVFIHGCFWHKCPLCFRSRKSNEEYWIPKLDINVQRDKVNEMNLRNYGWKVAVIWEHEIKRCPIDELQNLLKSKGIILRNKGELEN